MDNTTYAQRRRQRRLEAQRALQADLQRYRDQHAQLAAQVILRRLQSPDPRIRRQAEALARKRGLR